MGASISEYRDATEAATQLGHATYSGTVSPASRQDTGQVSVYRDATEAATQLGHATYSGTVSPASRQDASVV